ncbi:response regulator [Flavitalea sp.]|nr:response regulator [Flavitalea sp.]
MEKMILLVDDDEDEFELFIEALHETHFTCDCIFAKTAEQALNLLCYTVPDTIFLDYNMPKINGLKCLTKIKQITNLKDVPVILYSNAITDELSKIAISLGATLCIKKPNKFNTLVEILHQVLTNRWRN